MPGLAAPLPAGRRWAVPPGGLALPPAAAILWIIPASRRCSPRPSLWIIPGGGFVWLRRQFVQGGLLAADVVAALVEDLIEGKRLRGHDGRQSRTDPLARLGKIPVRGAAAAGRGNRPCAADRRLPGGFRPTVGWRMQSPSAAAGAATSASSPPGQNVARRQIDGRSPPFG